MGNKNLNKNSFDVSGQLIPNQHELQILYQCQQGQVAQSLTNTKQYFIRQLAFPNSNTLQKSLEKLQKLKHSMHKPSMLIDLLQIQTIHIKSMCASQHRLRLVFEYSKFSLNDQIQARIQKQKYLDYVDSCRIIIGCVRALAQVQDLVIQNGQLFTNGVCHRVFINPQRILVMNQGQIKIISPLITSPYDRFQHRNNSYYSPQKLSDFDYNEDEKSCLFELGITLIHVLTLKNCRDVYNGFQVKQDQIDKKIHQIWQLYSDSLICEILSRLTRTFRPIRSNLQQSIAMVKNLQDKLMQVLYQQQPKTNPMKLQLNKIHKTIQQQQQQQQHQLQQHQQQQQQQQQRIISEIQLTTQTIQSQQQQQDINLQNRHMFQKYYQDTISDFRYMTNRIDIHHNKQNCSLKYSRSIIRQKQYQYNNQIQQDILTNKPTTRSNLNKIITQRDKQNHQTQNIHINTNTNTNTNTNINTNMNTNMGMKQLPHSSTSKKTRKQQSCIVTNQCPFYNLPHLTHTQLQRNSAYLSFLRCNNNGKQSYEYGKNDIQAGIIPFVIGHNNIRIKQNLQTQQQQASPQVKQYTNQMQQQQIQSHIERQKQKVKKFQWKRTQFNKKKTKITKNNHSYGYNIQNINKITSTTMNKTHAQYGQVNRFGYYQ